MIWNTCIVLCTRPEVIKMSPVVRACEKKGVDWFMIHTGQHHSYNMDRVFFDQLWLPEEVNRVVADHDRRRYSDKDDPKRD